MNRVLKTVVLMAFAMGVATFTGCGSVVPPGKTVIIVKPSGKNVVKKQGVYRGLGRDKVFFIDNRLNSFSERDMQILCKDDINMSVDVKILMAFEADEKSIEFIKNKMPVSKGGEWSLDVFYKMAVQPILRATARNVVSQYSTDDIREAREQIAIDIDTVVRAELKSLGYPLHVSAVLVSNIDYPKLIKDQREAIKKAQLDDLRKAALAEADVAEAQRRVVLEQENAKIALVRAQAKADENRMLTDSLTPQFLRWRELEVMLAVGSEIARGNNNTVYMLPFDMMNMDNPILEASLLGDAIGGAVKK